MREMQIRAFESRDAQYLLLKTFRLRENPVP